MKNLHFPIVLMFVGAFTFGCSDEPSQLKNHESATQNLNQNSTPSEPPVAQNQSEKMEKPDSTKPTDQPISKKETEKKEAAEQKPAAAPSVKLLKKGLSEADWTEIPTLDESILIDIRYATENNFTKTKVYDCPRCYLRPDAAKALVAAHKALKARGLGLKMFDCYRPRPYQQRLWDKVPNPDYVTPPQKGSMHSRGAAVDLTVVDKKGKELDMGTPYDFFGEEAHSDCTRLPAKVLENRKILKDAMEAVGFRGIRTEWWHFSFGKKEFELSSAVWECR